MIERARQDIEDKGKVKLSPRFRRLLEEKARDGEIQAGIDAASEDNLLRSEENGEFIRNILSRKQRFKKGDKNAA